MEKILTARQVALLEAVGKDSYLSKHFYLTGGTPLAAFYLQHRLSEDLDFFSEDEVDPTAIHIFFRKHKKSFGIKKIDFEQSFNRHLFFLHFKDEILKTEFTYFPFPRIEIGPKKHGVIIDSMIDIAVNKVFTIYSRTKARDYIDLYSLCSENNLKISDLIKKARQKFDWHIDPIQLGTQFLKAKIAPDLPRMIRKISTKDWQEFFQQEAKKLQKDILK